MLPQHRYVLLNAMKYVNETIPIEIYHVILDYILYEHRVMLFIKYEWIEYQNEIYLAWHFDGDDKEQSPELLYFCKPLAS